jgi:hypothetical protein
MGTFFRGRHGLDYEQGFVQGAGRVLICDRAALATFPATVEDVLDLTVGVTQYDPVTPWTEAGFTKTGINITRNNAEEDFDVDQVRGSILRRPTNWEMSVGTQLAEASLETFQLAWELGTITAITGPPVERSVGLSAPTSYSEHCVAVCFQFDSGIIRVWAFRRCIRAAQESGMTLQKTGEQVSLPVRWNALADTDQPIDSQFGIIIENAPAPPP